jgi:hypothetical protein
MLRSRIEAAGGKIDNRVVPRKKAANRRAG